ncbi:MULTISPECIES: 2,3-epoxybenzoyl-CoA dihydrolase [Rhodobacterales]|jgi:benzoyl-CoA-dihydrodiol lyase|uniref:2,3-epoxybenzoyl-CoA dihydrolase n=1 Tax=Rhodobacterales TaxID=204455 RepID=UPI00237F1E52|nr:2,3-epoxybenzoyl-CoA dihydrolase [Phaeobacter gallaeciensis]MEC9312872.1 2,3-epoxybenzoyl-CoA dihydrolase [Pseudomonadota bacterium]MDE4192023.1 2,3-epoxybenzoyl-CoA dihydrolase [Phaeobacter gallaeciensis]MDE4200486.1 2,3-epoxybenzoyl-CoA dihydrolase [Phaeobacter gallaeciensis]MDE4204639.1 2,3-epoxybenzoyl-CoA dihydrolase [Phaeobacter gallaeciensis]MDE4208778.1 2,3-epoxybenzoyl-CoA dihydrolase [Phaeobacter gallaeciensis]
MPQAIDFQTDPSKYRHWRVEYDGPIANLYMDVDEDGGLFDGYQLKLNSYDLGVDIELSDIVQRMRFEHPEVKVVIMRSGKDKVFCAGANIRMLGGASHAHKVNFCKFTNETRNTYEAAEADSGQKYIAAVQGACAGGGYELALACNYIMLTNDSASSVALPEVPLLAVLPGTGGLTRVTDKRKVRRDLADIFCSVEEGVKGQRAVDWRLVDEVVPNSKFADTVAERAQEFAAASSKADGLTGITLGPITRSFGEDSITYTLVEVEIDRKGGRATVTLKGPDGDAPADTAALQAEGDQTYLLRLARELDDAILHLRLNEREVGTVVFQTQGDAEKLLAHEALLLNNRDHWLANEILMYWKRLLKRVDMTSRSLVAVVEHGSCFAGPLAELLWAVDRSYMMLEEFEGDNRPLAAITLSEGNFGTYPMGNDLTRLQTRFLGTPESVEALRDHIGEPLEADQAEELGLVTYAFDDIDWEDEVRIFLEERASFSPDAMTGMEANLRFAGPETMETRIFGRLTAWQNWIFQRPNAVGSDGALQRYGTGQRGEYNMERV